MTAADDLVLPFRLGRTATRGRLVRLGPAVDRVLSQHDYPPVVSQVLGELLALGAVLATTIKYDGFFTLQTRGDGPVQLMVVDITSGGDLRGYADFDAAALDAVIAQAGGERPSLPRILGAGHLAFTVDQGPDTERYQGIVALEGDTLAACAHAYFRQSEQIETGIVLACEKVEAAWRAGAVMLQKLPDDGGHEAQVPGEDHEGVAQFEAGEAGEADEDWRRAMVLMSSVTPPEMLDPDLAAPDLAYRLFHEEGVRGYPERALRFGCRCSRERIERTLTSLPEDEVRDMLEDGKLVVTCQFCNSAETFNEQALDALFAA